MTEPNYVKVRFGPNERGWAEDLGDNRFRIANVPFDSKVGFRDIVTYNGDPQHSLPIIIERAFPHKGNVYYEPKTREKFVEIREFAEEAEFSELICLEGAVPGLIMMGFKDGFEPVKFFKEISGVRIEILEKEEIRI